MNASEKSLNLTDNCSLLLNDTEVSSVNLNDNIEFREMDLSDVVENGSILANESTQLEQTTMDEDYSVIQIDDDSVLDESKTQSVTDLSVTLQEHERTNMQKTKQMKHSNINNNLEQNEAVDYNARIVPKANGHILDDCNECATTEVATETTANNVLETANHNETTTSICEESITEESGANIGNTLNTIEYNESTQGTAAADQNETTTASENSVQNEHLEVSLANEATFFETAFIEVGRRLWSSTAQEQHYTKGCLWSPDGTCILVPVHLDGMHVIELPPDIYDIETLSTMRKVSDMQTAVHVKEGGTVYDFTWYPFMNSNAPETCCWLATRQHEPIHMWDAFNGELRCSYRGYDDVDEVESAISLTFSNDGQKVFAGYKKSIKIFDTNIPGRDCSTVPVKQAVSCFALTDSNDDTVTVGSWNGFINHYDLRVPKLGSLFTLGGHTGGVTWLRYAALDDNWALLSGARKDNKILQWDMRNYTKPVREFVRNVSTNQRIHFDLSPQQQWLVSGDTSGTLRIWDLIDADGVCAQVPLHGDCCNGVNFHPTRPILATTSGQYHFVNVAHDDDMQKEPIDVDARTVDYENALLLLWLGKHSVASD